MAKISVAQAVRNCIEAERASARFYRLLEESTSDAEAKKLLGRMAQDETKHAEAIEKMASDLVEGELPLHADDGARLIEVAEGWQEIDDIDWASALEMAMEGETNAAMVYDAMADFFGEEKVKRFFRDLSETEEGHHAMLQKIREGRKAT